MEQGWCPRTLDLSPTGESAKYWGSESPCHLKHPRPYGYAMSMDLVWWIHLGFDTEPRSSREWLDPTCRSLRVYQPCWTRLYAFLDSADLTVDDLERYGYVVMIPGHIRPMKLRNDEDFLLAMVGIWESLDKNEKLWCLSPPPVVLFCTAKQAERCIETDWYDCVAKEAALALENPDESEESDTSGSEDQSEENDAPGAPIPIPKTTLQAELEEEYRLALEANWIPESPRPTAVDSCEGKRTPETAP
ncbi:Fc.00g097650.m01.CDS01 [Cosmosporella sp. VM-42]